MAPFQGFLALGLGRVGQCLGGGGRHSLLRAFLRTFYPFVKESYRRDAGMTGRGEEESAAEKTPESKTTVSLLLAETGSCSMGLALCLLVAGNMLVTCAFFFF